MNGLLLLVTLIVHPGVCQSPCIVHYTAKLEYPSLRGELCVNLVHSNEVDNSNDHTKSCYVIDEHARRFLQNDFKHVDSGLYSVYVTIDDKIVSQKWAVRVTGHGIEVDEIKHHD